MVLFQCTWQRQATVWLIFSGSLFRKVQQSINFSWQLKPSDLAGGWWRTFKYDVIPQTTKPGHHPAAAEDHLCWWVLGWQASCIPAQSQNSWDPGLMQMSPGTNSCSSLYCEGKEKKWASSSHSKRSKGNVSGEVRWWIVLNETPLQDMRMKSAKWNMWIKRIMCTARLKKYFYKIAEIKNRGKSFFFFFQMCAEKEGCADF